MAQEPKSMTFYQGSRLFRQGDDGGTLFMIQEGTVEISIRSEKTGLSSVVGTKGKGSVLGILSFLEGDKRNATGIAKTDVIAKVIDQDHRKMLLKSIPKWFAVLVKDLSITLRNLTSEYSDIETVFKATETKHRVVRDREAKLEAEMLALQTNISAIKKQIARHKRLREGTSQKKQNDSNDLEKNKSDG